MAIRQWREKLSSPIPQVQEIVTDGAAGNFGNRRQDAFELAPADPFYDLADELFGEACFDTFFRTIPLVNQ